MELIYGSWGITAFVCGVCFRFGWKIVDMVMEKSQKKHGV
jgi:hypothetical protein